MTATLTEPSAATVTSRFSAAKPRRINNLVWFEMPVRDLDRATRFYEAAFAIQLQTNAGFPGLAMFPRIADEAVTGAIMEISDPDDPHQSQPCDGGTVVYLNCDGDIDGVLARVKASGGAILQEVVQLPNNLGYSAQFRDPDGNRVGLHASF